MPENLRPRVQEFSPFKRLEPIVGGGDTYARPVVDDSAVRRTSGTLDALRSLSPSLNRYLDAQLEFEQRELQQAAQAAVADLSPDEMRQASAAKWEKFSKETKFDNGWWPIYLDEASGRKLALEFDERLRSRGLEATNPENPNAHVAVLEEERARATEGMSFYQRAEFERLAEGVEARARASWAESREARFQSKMEGSFRDEVRGLVRAALDPAQGGVVDLAELTTVMARERARSGNDGRAEIYSALNDALTVQIGQADTPEQLDAIRVRAASVLADVGALELGDAGAVDDLLGNEMDNLELLLEQQTTAREDALLRRTASREGLARNELNGEALALAARVFRGDMTDEEANAAMRQKAAEVASRTGVSPDLLLGHSMIALQEQSGAVQSARYAQASDPDVLAELRRQAGAENFDPGSFSVALAGARDGRKLSRDDYSALLELGSSERMREFEKVAETYANAQAKPLGDRVIEQAGPFLDSIVDPDAREQARAVLLSDVDAALAAERARLASAIRSAGADNTLSAVDAWTKDYLTRSGEIVQTIISGAQAGLPPSVRVDAGEAFRSRVRESAPYKAARQKWIYEYSKANLTQERLDQILPIGVEGTVDDFAAQIAFGRVTDQSGAALELYNEAEESFLSYLEIQGGLATTGVTLPRAIAEADSHMRGGVFEVPRPKAPAKLPEQAAAEGEQARASVSQMVGRGALDVESAAAALAEAQSRVAGAEEGGFPQAIQAEAETAAREAEERFAKVRAQTFAQHRRVLESVASGLRPDLGDPLYGGLARVSAYDPITNPDAAGPDLEIRNGRIHIARPPTQSRKTYLGFGPIVRSVDTAGYKELQDKIENQFIAAKLWTGLTLEEVKAGKAKPMPDATPDQWINLDRKMIAPVSVPFFGSVAELEAADLTEWLTLFPSYSRETFMAAQRLVILKQIAPPEEPK